MKYLKITAAAAAILLIILIFLPVPLHIDQELEGRRIVDNAEKETVEIQVHGWRFHYLVRKNALDWLRADLRISPFGQEEALDFSFSAPVLSHDGVSRAEPARYSALRNEYIAAQICFTDDFDMILYTDETAGDSIYAASDAADQDLTDVIGQLSP